MIVVMYSQNLYLLILIIIGWKIRDLLLKLKKLFHYDVFLKISYLLKDQPMEFGILIWLNLINLLILSFRRARYLK